ncbi:MAG TPA: VWA domain-containing protein, partial [bacterium]
MSYVANTQTNLTKFCVSAFVCLLAISSFCNLQAQPQDSLAVSIQNIFTDGVSLRGYTANYPYPILSIISVLDTSDHPVRGLADTLKWLGPNDIANNGRPISKIWQPLFDYKSDEASAIEASNLYNLRSCSDSLQPHFIAGVPATTMLLMDVSGSVYDIDSDLVNVREGIKSFIADMRPEDRAGVIQFNCEFKHLAPTNDRDSLNAFVDSARRGDWTPLYEAIINAIDSIKDESSLLRSIVVYTDGKNNLPNDTTKCPQILREQLTEDSVIVEANKFRIPVYVIALGNGTSDPILKKIADATGGQFYKSDNGSDFTDKYRQISDIIQNYYVMAHQSPQPCESGFLRTVDITVNDSTAAGIRAGSERAEYEATGPPPLYDLELTMSADKECVFEGDVINFFLTIKNQGPDPAFNICLKDSLSEYLRPDRALSWNLVSLGAMETFEVSFSATVDAALPDSTKELLNFARVIADCDSDSVSLRLCVKPKEYDLSIAKSGDVDTVTLGEIITYTIAITNLGPNTADSLSVCDTIPELLIPLDFDGEFDGNVLCWSHLNPLAVGDTLFIPYTARVDNQLPNSPDTLINTARVFAKNDTNPSNNTARDTVIVTVPEQPECDLAIQKSADQDTVKS